jgi:hypothetical protein
MAAEIVPPQGHPWLLQDLATPTPTGEPGRQWRRITSPNGETRVDDDWELVDRKGRMAARVRQEGAGYWVAKPRITPEPPIESFKCACRRAIEIAVVASAWPESERHSAHPGMTASQFDAACRNLRRKHPDWTVREAEQHIIGVLKPSMRTPSRPVAEQAAAAVRAATISGAVIPEDLSIPDFLRWLPPTEASLAPGLPTQEFSTRLQ